MSETSPAWYSRVRRLTDYLSTDFLGGPKWLKLSWVINFQKAGTLPFVALLMWGYNNTSVEAWIYLALHGSYGFCWLLKDVTFGDPAWQRRVTLGGGIMSFLMVLGPYWILPWLLISGICFAPPTHSMSFLAFVVIWHTMGVAIMFAADCQKYYTLKVQKGLITDGMFKYVRHPNYTGEIIIYSSYALILNHWVGWAILLWVWCGLFLINILNKEASMSRYPEWAAYKKRTGYLTPWL